MARISSAINTLEYPEYLVSDPIYDAVFQALISDHDLEQLSNFQAKFNPGDHNVREYNSLEGVGVESIPEENMGELLDVLIHCAEGVK